MWIDEVVRPGFEGGLWRSAVSARTSTTPHRLLRDRRRTKALQLDRERSQIAF